MNVLPTKEVWVKLIHIINNIVTLGTSVAVLQALANTFETAGRRKEVNTVEITQAAERNENKNLMTIQVTENDGRSQQCNRV